MPAERLDSAWLSGVTLPRKKSLPLVWQRARLRKEQVFALPMQPQGPEARTGTAPPELFVGPYVSH